MTDRKPKPGDKIGYVGYNTGTIYKAEIIDIRNEEKLQYYVKIYDRSSTYTQNHILAIGQTYEVWLGDTKWWFEDEKEERINVCTDCPVSAFGITHKTNCPEYKKGEHQ